MDTPSSSNVTGRRKRNAAPDVDYSPIPGTAIRKVRGTKQPNPVHVVPDSMMQQVNQHVDDIINNKKVGTSNCFEYKSPLEMYGIQKMLEANASITEMAIVLESCQIILGHRVDRLHHDVRQVDSALSSGDVSRGTGSDDVHVTIESRKARKKMAITDGMSGMSDFLSRVDDPEAEVDDDVRHADFDRDYGRDADDDDNNAGEPRINVTANSKDVDLFTQRDIVYGDLIKSLAIERAVYFQAEIAQESSALVSADDTAHDIKDSSIDWLKTNPTFQKATKGSLDNTATSFHSLNHLGLHSPSGRTMILHPRIQDKHADDQFFASDVTASLAKNTRALLENSLAKKPTVLDNYLMLEVRDRPVIGRYKIMAKDVKKSTLPLAEASRERDLANLTFAEMNRVASADMTIAGASDMSMLPGSRELPLSIGDNDEIDDANPNNTVSTSPQLRVAKDEYVPPNLEALALEESLIGKIPIDLMDMEELSKMFENKMKEFGDANSFEAKIWKNGLRAEEWGNDEASLKAEIRNTYLSGVDGWIKATDSWTNYDVVKMPINRETKQLLEESVPEEPETYRNLVPEIGKNLFLVPSDEFRSGYPPDRFQELKMVGEDLDVMKMAQDGDEEDIPLEQIQREIQQRHDAEEEIDIIDDFEYDAGAVQVDFDDRLAAPADEDDIPMRAMNGGDRQIPQILFGEPLDEPQDEIVGDNARQQHIEEMALGADEVAELMTAAVPPEMVGPSAEQREEIRNIGKNDNAHWVHPEIAERERNDFLLAQRKRKDKKAKGRRATVEDYSHYFRDLGEDELEREVTAVKCEKIADEKTTFLTEQQVYLPTLGTENKPHCALEIQELTSSGLFFNKPFGKLKVERIAIPRREPDAVFVEDSTKCGNKDSDCLNWLLSFNGFRCMENPEAVTSEKDNTGVSRSRIFPMDDDYVADVNNYDDEYDRYNPRFAHEAAAAQMGAENLKKFANFSSNLFQLQDFLPRAGEYGDSDDEFDDSFDRQSIQAKNLDAAKHKKCLADILNNDTLSMPCIQYALEQLTVNNQTLRQNNTTVQGPSTSERDATMRSPTPAPDSDTTLTTVFDYHSPNKMNHDVNDIIKALTDMTDFEEEATASKKPTSSKYGTANTENRKVKINGFHTLLSLALSMPPKMGESVKPSSIVSFILHVANENSLKIVQDRSKRSWMSDFVVLNQADQLPRGLKIGKIDETDDFWKKTQDPDAIEGSAADESPLFASLINPTPALPAPRAKAVPARRGRPQRAQSPAELGAIEEEEDEEMES